MIGPKNTARIATTSARIGMMIGVSVVEVAVMAPACPPLPFDSKTRDAGETGVMGSSAALSGPLAGDCRPSSAARRRLKARANTSAVAGFVV